MLREPADADYKGPPSRVEVAYLARVQPKPRRRGLWQREPLVTIARWFQ